MKYIGPNLIFEITHQLPRCLPRAGSVDWYVGSYALKWLTAHLHRYILSCAIYIYWICI